MVILLSKAVLETSTWIMNLTVANEEGPDRDPIIWFELYQAKKEYSLTDLSPTSMNDEWVVWKDVE